MQDNAMAHTENLSLAAYKRLTMNSWQLGDCSLLDLQIWIHAIITCQE